MNLRAYLQTVVNLRKKTCFSKTEENHLEMMKERLELIIQRKAEVYYRKVDLICTMSVQNLHEQKLYNRSFRSPLLGEICPGFSVSFYLLHGAQKQLWSAFVKYLCRKSSLLKICCLCLKPEKSLGV